MAFASPATTAQPATIYLVCRNACTAYLVRAIAFCQRAELFVDIVLRQMLGNRALQTRDFDAVADFDFFVCAVFALRRNFAGVVIATGRHSRS